MQCCKKDKVVWKKLERLAEIREILEDEKSEATSGKGDMEKGGRRQPAFTLLDVKIV